MFALFLHLITVAVAMPCYVVINPNRKTKCVCNFALQINQTLQQSKPTFVGLGFDGINLCLRISLILRSFELIVEADYGPGTYFTSLFLVYASAFLCTDIYIYIYQIYATDPAHFTILMNQDIECSIAIVINERREKHLKRIRRFTISAQTTWSQQQLIGPTKLVIN